MVDGKEITMQVKAGDKVIYSKYSGTEVEVEEEKYVIVKMCIRDRRYRIRGCGRILHADVRLIVVTKRIFIKRRLYCG